MPEIETAPDAQGATPTTTAPQNDGAFSQPEPTPPPEANQGLVIPSQDAAPEAWDNFYKQMGRPDTPEGYALELPEGDKGEFAKHITPLLHQAGLTQHQAAALSKGWNELQAAAQKEAQQAELAKAAKQEAEAEDLRKEWGEQYDTNIEMAARAKAQFLPEERADAIIDAIAGVVGVKSALSIMQSIGKSLSEDSAAGLGGHGTKGKLSVADALFDKS